MSTGLLIRRGAGGGAPAFALAGAARLRAAARPAGAAPAAAAAACVSAARPAAAGGALGALAGLAPAALGAAAAAARRLAGSPRRRHSRQQRAVVTRAAEGDPQSDVSLIEFRVGQVVSCENHPDSDKLLVEMIDVGEDEPRQICSGIAKHFSPEQVTGRRVVIVANLKERKIGGVSSNGMLLCASVGEEEDQKLDIVAAPEGAAVGERVVIEVEGQSHGDPAAPNRVAKKKLYEKVAPELRTDAEGTVCFAESQFTTSGGPCTAKAIPSGVVS